jgi:hypothetical protein
MPERSKQPSGEFTQSSSGLFTPEPRTGAHSDLGIGDFSLSKGLERLQGRRDLLIYMHDNPDPDARGAAMASGSGLSCM